jgi:hypothetical protein
MKTRYKRFFKESIEVTLPILNKILIRYGFQLFKYPQNTYAFKYKDTSISLYSSVLEEYIPFPKFQVMEVIKDLVFKLLETLKIRCKTEEEINIILDILNRLITDFRLPSTLLSNIR